MSLKKKFTVFTCSMGLAAFMWTGTALAAEVTVQKNDSLWSIAKKHGTTVESIKKLNNLKSDMLKLGQVLQLPDKKVKQAERREPAVQKQASRGNPERVDELLKYAESLLDAKYRYGGETPSGFDCSGYVRYVFKHFGIELMRSSAEQYKSDGAPVDKEDLLPGDLVFFNTSGKGISHVGIYLGNSQFISASSASRGVVIDSLTDKYWGPRYRGAKRVISEQ